MVDRFAVSTCNKGVTADKPAGAGVCKRAANVGAAKRTPFVTVSGLGSSEYAFRWSNHTQAGREADPQGDQLRDAS
jgi:hypothetical protein